MSQNEVKKPISKEHFAGKAKKYKEYRLVFSLGEDLCILEKRITSFIDYVYDLYERDKLVGGGKSIEDVAYRTVFSIQLDQLKGKTIAQWLANGQAEKTAYVAIASHVDKLKSAIKKHRENLLMLARRI